jgi:hypothetical protein
MLEIVSDMTVLWISVILTVLVVSAFTKASMSFCQWTIRTSWKHQFQQFEAYQKLLTHFIRPKSVRYHQKIPSNLDKKASDDDDDDETCFCCSKVTENN